MLCEWISDCLYYPQFRLSDAPEFINKLGINSLEVFDEDTQRWIGASLDFEFTLKTNCDLFLCRRGVVRCRDFELLLTRSKNRSRPTHLRHNMKGERDSV